MRCVFEYQGIGHDLMCEFLVALSAVLNHHLLAQGNTIQLSVPAPRAGEDGTYRVEVQVEFDMIPAHPFLTKG